MSDEQEEEMHPIERSRVDFTPKLEDYRAFTAYVLRDRNRGRFWMRLLVAPVVVATIVFGSQVGKSFQFTLFFIMIFSITALIAFGLVAALVFWAERVQAKRLFQVDGHDHQSIEITEKGIDCYSSSHESRYNWGAIQEITEARQLLLLVTGSAGGGIQAIFIPKDAFENETQYSQFKKTVTELWQRNQ